MDEPVHVPVLVHVADVDVIVIVYVCVDIGVSVCMCVGADRLSLLAIPVFPAVVTIRGDTGTGEFMGTIHACVEVGKFASVHVHDECAPDVCGCACRRRCRGSCPS